MKSKLGQAYREIEILRNECPIYIPKANDEIDLAIGKFINNYPEKNQLKIMFLRETEGVYQFGTKRIYVKVDRGDQVKIRVGGGFLPIEEFLDTYISKEVPMIKKVVNDKPLNRFVNLIFFYTSLTQFLIVCDV